ASADRPGRRGREAGGQADRREPGVPRVGLILGVDGGNSKTELLAATTDGDRVAYIRGPGSNSHSMGAEGALAVVDALVDRARLEEPAEHGALFLCGADTPSDIAALERGDVRRDV